jgi:hypothetical protein
MKKISLLGALTAIMAAVLVFAQPALAATPTLSLSSTGTGDSVQITVTGDPSVSVVLFYTTTNNGSQASALGTTDSGGNFSATISTSAYGIASGSSVYVKTNGLSGPQSASVTWPNASTSGAFSLSPTGVVLTVGQAATITVSNNGSYAIYLSNSSNPPVANANINGNTITVTGLSNGSSSLTFCTVGSSSSVSSSPSCASAYVTVGSGGGQALTFSLNNITVAPGQSVPVTISGGNGAYSVFNNSNSSVIQTSISGSVVTLSTNTTSGSAAVTICSSDMASCGIINATAGSSSTLPLTFSPPNPTVSAGQSLSVVISGGTSSTYYVSSNSNSTAVGTGISGNILTLTGSSNGTATLIVCSSSGSCGTLNVTISYVSSGGALTLSQSSVVLLVGQVLSITVSGGTSPYNLNPAGAGSIFQASVNGNIVTLSGIAAGSSTLNVCSAGGACAALSVTVNASGVGTPITFSQNNLNLNAGAVTALTISGSGGYYVSTSANPAVASVQISGNTALVTALAAGSTNISICQSGGQCAILFVTVTTGTSTALVPTFSQTAPTVPAGQVVNITISGGATSNYYILSNTNPTIVQLSLNGNQLALTGLTAGSSMVAVCATANSCGVLNVTVNGTVSANVSFTTNSLQTGTVGQAYSVQLGAAGGSGSYSYAVTGGSLPAGLSLSSAGLVSGTPTVAGTQNATIKVTDSSGNSAVGSFSFTVNAPAASLTAPTVPTAASIASYSNGQLINENGTIYIVYQNTKVGFANAPAFLGLGFKFSNVIATANSDLAVSPKVVVTADGAHPRGTWVNSGKTVYFVTPAGLIPVPTWDIFLSNGGQAGFIVPADSYDLAMPKLPLMVLNDSRMK